MSKQKWNRPEKYKSPGWYPDPENPEHRSRVRYFDGEDWGCCSVSSNSGRNRPAAETASNAAVSALLPAAFAIPAIYFLQEFSLLMWVALAMLIGMFGAASESFKTARLCKNGTCFYTPKDAYLLIGVGAVLSLWFAYELVAVFACVPWSNDYWLCD